MVVIMVAVLVLVVIQVMMTLVASAVAPIVAVIPVLSTATLAKWLLSPAAVLLEFPCHSFRHFFYSKWNVGGFLALFSILTLF